MLVQAETDGTELNPDVVIVGAGPVGLWTAVQIKLLRPHNTVLILEKYKEYQRKHLLRLKQASMAGCPADPRLLALVRSLPPAVRTSELEGKVWGGVGCGCMRVCVVTCFHSCGLFICH